ncbi:hypothetical protein PsorP6_013134 [Peronosclerospora sorghi]|uniref:Uncharacterized protein n=1 Tax=Peronosclerospora sorghi TaxID=230839 RepID=A0ACC0WHM5_9STRA|nr:hypothetical protein PsorP6_013134 [Peronosclerospora sorghi]
MLNSEDEDESRTTMITCGVHKLKKMMADGRVIKLSDVLEQWNLKEVEEVKLPKRSEYDMPWNQLYEDYKNRQPQIQAALLSKLGKS